MRVCVCYAIRMIRDSFIYAFLLCIVLLGGVVYCVFIDSSFYESSI